MTAHPTPPAIILRGRYECTYENDTYAAFSKYIREAASGRRGTVTLASILQFATGMDEEPPLGFELQPSIQFVAANEGIKTVVFHSKS